MAHGLAVTRGRAAAVTYATLAITACALIAHAAWPAPAHAADLFPVDDWVGDGIKKAGDIALGPLKLGVKEIAALIATIVGALADLIVPKALVESGLDGIMWLVQLPPVGSSVSPRAGEPEVRMPHLQQLRDTMTWIGVTLLPLGLIVSAGRAFFNPAADGDSPAELVGRVLVAGLGLVLYDWGWGVATELSRRLTAALLGLPWVADGVEKMLETLLIGGGAGTVAAAEFVIPLMVMIAGAVLLALLLVRVGLEVATALLYVLGGLAFGLSVTALGKRLLSAWLVAASAIVLLPLMWATVFAVGAALMVDAGHTAGEGDGLLADLLAFVAQLYNVAAALAVFWIAIKLARGVFQHASGAITGITANPGTGSGRAGGQAPGGRLAALANKATPKGLAQFSQNLRGGLATDSKIAARGVARAGSFPVRHPVRAGLAAAYPARHPVQATREAANQLAEKLTGGGSQLAGAVTQAAGQGRQRAAGFYRSEKEASRFTAAAVQQRRAARTGTGAAARTGTAAAAVPPRPAQPAASARQTGSAPGPPKGAPAPSRSEPPDARDAGSTTRPGARPTPAAPETGRAIPPPAPGSGAGARRPVWLARPKKRDEKEDKK